jgi:hypothetical protein
MPLEWDHTWPGRNLKDYTGTDPDRPRLFARIYLSNRIVSDTPCYWTVAEGNRQIDSGL